MLAASLFWAKLLFWINIKNNDYIRRTKRDSFNEITF